MPNSYNHTGQWMAESEGRVRAFTSEAEKPVCADDWWVVRTVGRQVGFTPRAVAIRRANECTTAVGGRHPSVM